MFDIGFWEMAFIGVIALVVIGPERLPGAARNVGLWVGKGRRMLAEIQADVKKEIDAQDLAQVKEIKDELTAATKELGDIASVDSDPLGIKEAGEDLKKSMDEIRASAKGESTKPLEKTSPAPTRKTTKKKTAKKKTAKKKPSSSVRKTSKKKTAKKKTAKKKTAKKKTVKKKTVKKKPSSSARKTSKKKTDGKNGPSSPRKATKGVSAGKQSPDNQPATKTVRKLVPKKAARQPASTRKTAIPGSKQV